MTDSKLISPVAIDLGGKNIGLYFSQYQNGGSLEQYHSKSSTLVLPDMMEGYRS